MSDLKAKLEQANEKVVKAKAERTAKVVKGAHLTEQFLSLATEAGLTVTPSKSGAFNVITGAAGKARRIYVSTRGGTVDFSGFTVETDAVNQISEEEAKAKHLGAVRGRINFNASDEDILAAYNQALTVTNTALPEKEKPVKTPRVPKIPKQKQVELEVHNTNVAD